MEFEALVSNARGSSEKTASDEYICEINASGEGTAFFREKGPTG